MVVLSRTLEWVLAQEIWQAYCESSGNAGSAHPSFKAAIVAFVLEHLRVIKLGNGGVSFDFRMELGKVDRDIVCRK